VVSVANVSEHLHEGEWAKEALSADYRAVIALPVMDEHGVLYGVLSAHSTQVEAFEGTEGAALEDVADLLATYHRVHAVRATQTRGEQLELEFEIRDPSYPLLAVARRLETQLRFETVVGVREDAVRVLVEVADGASVAPETAADVTVVRDADWFGNRSAGRLLLELVPPCLVTAVSKHGAEVRSAVVDPEAATVVLSYPANNPVRPLFELLQSLYTAVDLEARRQTSALQSRSNRNVVDTLTDRQREIITAAYYGGYFDTPKAISGEDLAENFDISNSAVSKHLRAAQRSLLEHLLDSTSDNRGFNDQP
jgi:predicted DNA binding protein